MRLIERPQAFSRPMPRSLTPGQLRRAGHGDTCSQLWTGWRVAPLFPVRIIAHLASPVSLDHADAIHLDAVLSWAVLNRPDAPPIMPEPLLEACIVPLPLGLAWLSPEGWPLWTASDLSPAGTATRDVIYVHRRFPEHREPLQRERGANTSAGRWKDARLPHRVVVADRLEAIAIGDVHTISELLQCVTHLGKKTAHGRGRVLSWEVTPAPEVRLKQVLERRPTPVAALAADEAVHVGRLGRGGYTPPYWDARRFRDLRMSAHG